MENFSGEVVCDSILQNKHKTKSYWEQLMMAAVTSEQPSRTTCHASDEGSGLPTVKSKDLLSTSSEGENSKPQSEISEQEFYDARSQISLSSQSEPLDSLDTIVATPKIVESVAKKLFLEAEIVQTKHTINANGEESVIEREIRLQKDKEEALARERQEAFLKLSAISQPTSVHETPEHGIKHDLISANKLNQMVANAETKIALELHEMRRREEELKRQRQKLQISNGTSQFKEPHQAADDLINGILHTNEVDLPEYGHEEKGLSVDGNRGQKETPIEREIRLARKREEEFRREKLLFSPNVQSTTVPATAPEVTVKCNKESDEPNTSEPGSIQHSLGTGCIQQEICEATQTENEIREAGMVQATSEDIVDSKVANLSDLIELTVKEKDEKLKKCISSCNITSSGRNAPGPALEKKRTSVHSPISQRSVQNTNSVMDSRKFQNSVGQKGLMQRFIASRGKMSGIVSSSFVTSSPVTVQYLTPPHRMSPSSNKATDRFTEQCYESNKEPTEIQRNQTRRGYISAEEKIQVELLEMQKREEELRLQRASIFAQSQPNLLCMVEGDDSVGNSQTVEPQTQLRSSLSNPNLLDSENSLTINDDFSLKKPSGKTARRRKSALIAQWENRIQQYIEH